LPGAHPPRTRGGELVLSGDLDVRVSLPASTHDGCFSLAFSDGTLVSGQLLDGTPNRTFDVQIEGAAIVRIERQNGREALILNWRMEWMMVGQHAQICAESASVEAAEQLVLGFGTDLKRAA
jgi:hypothetical protein